MKLSLRRVKLYDRVGDGGPEFSPDHVRIEDTAEREKLVSFLNSGTMITRTTSRNFDVLDREKGRVVPIFIYTDGSWIWTAAHAYYLRTYGLAPEAEFVEHIASCGYQPRVPTDDEVAAALDAVRAR